MEELQGVIEIITFHNEENGYSILKCSVKESEDLFTFVGYMPVPSIGSLMKFYGSWQMHPRYGMQFYFEKFEEELPATNEGIEKYLSGKIKGIGVTLAHRIVKRFGLKTFEILDNDIEQLKKIQGINKKNFPVISESWADNRELSKILAFLQSYGATMNLATKIYNKYGVGAAQILKNNPYKLADEIWGVGFKTADEIAKNIGFEKNHYFRIRSGILYTLNKLSEEGHCFAFMNVLITKAAELLEVDKTILPPAIEKMTQEKDLIQEFISDKNNLAVYLPIYYKSEIGTARRLIHLLIEPREDFDFLDEEDFYSLQGIQYSPEQIEAIKAAINNKVLVLTGGPGTGKTTTTLGIISAYRRAGAKILLAAPTGRAAKRMAEVAQMEAQTIHRLLEARPPSSFGRNERNPLDGDVLIVDECSMIDILLMNSLLKAIPDEMTLILVGDSNQLPSVGAGKVLSDILSSGVVPSIQLTKIFRQAEKSKIITNAHRINNGDYLELDEKNSDFIFMEEKDKEKAADLIVRLCAEILPEKCGINPSDIQVLSPMRMGVIGTANLNLKLQNALNPSKVAIKYGFTEFRINDKIMQIRNNYEKKVFNGDIGFISNIDSSSGTITAIFDDAIATYEREEFNEIVLAYATTIHKSQGSEFPFVIMPMMMTHYIMLQRNLLYTGVTRAKKGLFLIGEKRAVFMAVNNNKIQERNTNLEARLKNYAVFFI